MAAPQQGGQSDNSAGILWGVAAIFATLGIVWYVFKAQIAAMFLGLKLAEVNMVTWFFNHIGMSTPQLDKLRLLIINLKSRPVNISFANLMLIGDIIGKWLRIPFVVLLFILGIVVYLGNKTNVFKRIYNMRDFAKMEKDNWPQITPVLDVDLLKEDIDKGPWAMAMSPMQYCKRYRLLQEVKPERREGMSRKDMGKIEVVLKRGEANKLFAMQLGPLWSGHERLPGYIKALFAIFAARINADSAIALKLIRQIAGSSSSKNLDLSGVDELLAKHAKSKIVQEIVQSHAYMLTVMATMLERSRDDGVQASSDFLWLKPMNRRLWYTLNTIGRQTPFVEVAGIFAHWKAEKEAGRALYVPVIQEATNALELALKEIVYRPDEN